MTAEHDLVLIHYEDRPLSYARIESIEPDHKRDWYHVKLLMLQVPPQVVTWILRDVYIDGEEFTMGGKRIRLDPVVPPPEAEPHNSDLDPVTKGALQSVPGQDATGRTSPKAPKAPAAPNGANPKPGKVITFPPKT